MVLHISTQGNDILKGKKNLMKKKLTQQLTIIL